MELVQLLPQQTLKMLDFSTRQLLLLALDSDP